MATLHPSTFEYQKPTDDQMRKMSEVRRGFAELAHSLNHLLPPGKDKNHILRQLRDCSMWANVSITRNADGSPRP
jgi:hypothetical protein